MVKLIRKLIAWILSWFTGSGPREIVRVPYAFPHVKPDPWQVVHRRKLEAHQRKMRRIHKDTWEKNRGYR